MFQHLRVLTGFPTESQSKGSRCVAKPTRKRTIDVLKVTGLPGLSEWTSLSLLGEVLSIDPEAEAERVKVELNSNGPRGGRPESLHVYCGVVQGFLQHANF